MKGKGVGKSGGNLASRVRGACKRAPDKIECEEDAGTSRITDDECKYERLVPVNGWSSKQRGYCCPRARFEGGANRRETWT